MSGIKQVARSAGARTIPVRLLRILGLVFALTLQGFVTQTHIHSLTHGLSALQQKGDPSKSLPDRDDSANCPLCKEIVQSGHFLGSAWLVLAGPAQSVVLLESAAALVPPTAHSSFLWRSRAPPRN